MDSHKIRACGGQIDFDVELDALSKEQLIDLVKRYYYACKEKDFKVTCNGGIEEGCMQECHLNFAMLSWYNYRLCPLCSDWTDGDKYTNFLFHDKEDETTGTKNTD